MRSNAPHYEEKNLKWEIIFMDNLDAKDVKSGKMIKFAGKVTIQQLKEIGMKELYIAPE